MQWLKLQMAKNVKVILIPKDERKEKTCGADSQARGVLEGEFVGKTELSCRLDCILEHCIGGTGFFKHKQGCFSSHHRL